MAAKAESFGWSGNEMTNVDRDIMVLANPEIAGLPNWAIAIVVLDAAPTDRILDALMRVKDTLDGTLAFRKSCAHGVCGSDGMIINGQERLSCKTLIQDVADGEGAIDDERFTRLRARLVNRARRIAETYGFHHLDTGLTYRAVARALMEGNEPLDDEALSIGEAIALLRAKDFEMPLQFNNFRD